MTREEKIKQLILLIDFVEGVKLEPEYFNEYPIEKIDKEIEFYDYVSEK